MTKRHNVVSRIIANQCRTGRWISNVHEEPAIRRSDQQGVSAGYEAGDNRGDVSLDFHLDGRTIRIMVDVAITANSDLSGMERRKEKKYADIGKFSATEWNFVPFVLSSHLTISKQAAAFYYAISGRAQLALIGQRTGAGCHRDTASLLAAVAESDFAALKMCLGSAGAVLDFVSLPPADLSRGVPNTSISYDEVPVDAVAAAGAETVAVDAPAADQPLPPGEVLRRSIQCGRDALALKAAATPSKKGRTFRVE
jgi:hypothetical protein